jgi:hypothetical protein
MRFRKQPAGRALSPYYHAPSLQSVGGGGSGVYWDFQSAAVGYATTVQNYTLQGGFWVPPGPNDASYINTNYMYDVVNPYRYSMNNCLHSRRLSRFRTAWPDSEGEFSHLRYTDPFGGQAYMYPLNSIITQSSDYNRCCHEVADSFYESGFRIPSLPHDVLIDKDPFDTGFSLWFLVVDLVQLLNVFKALTKTGAQMNLIARNRSSIPAGATARDFHNTNLGVQFGLLPTIRDLQHFTSLLMKWQAVYADMAKLMRTLRTRRFEPKDMSELHDVRTVDSIFHAPLFDVPLKAEITTTAAVFNRTAHYKFSAPEFQGWISRVKQFIDAFGILDPAAIWDIIPFSFVVDWFIDVSGFLHRHRPRLFPADVLFLDYCESIRWKRHIRWSVTSFKHARVGSFLPTVDPFIPMNNEDVGFEERTIYVRRRFRPHAERLSVPRIKSSFVNLRRVSISASLIAQRLPR